MWHLYGHTNLLIGHIQPKSQDKVRQYARYLYQRYAKPRPATSHISSTSHLRSAVSPAHKICIGWAIILNHLWLRIADTISADTTNMWRIGGHILQKSILSMLKMCFRIEVFLLVLFFTKELSLSHCFQLKYSDFLQRVFAVPQFYAYLSLSILRYSPISVEILDVLKI